MGLNPRAKHGPRGRRPGGLFLELVGEGIVVGVWGGAGEGEEVVVVEFAKRAFVLEAQISGERPGICVGVDVHGIIVALRMVLVDNVCPDQGAATL
jgi:hypothetical protein